VTDHVAPTEDAASDASQPDGTGADAAEAGECKTIRTPPHEDCCCDDENSLGTDAHGLECFCEIEHGCPLTFDEALAKTQSFCGNGWAVVVSGLQSGCAGPLNVVFIVPGLAGTTYFYDRASGKLVGAATGNDYATYCGYTTDNGLTSAGDITWDTCGACVWCGEPLWTNPIQPCAPVGPNAGPP
jgi:hypothetical protein